MAKSNDERRNASAQDYQGAETDSSAFSAAEGAPEQGSGAPQDQDVSEVVAEAEAILADAQAAEGTGEGAAEESAEDALAAELAQAKEEAAEWQGKYLRLQAEWDTYRRRMNEQRANEKVLATEKVMEDLLPVLDDFERTISYAKENGEAGLTDGVVAVQTKLGNVLAKHGLETIDPAGQPYDALEAQAVATVPDVQAYDETVAQVYQKGYKMGKKVLRAAMVTVTTGGPKRPTEDDAGE